MWVALQDELLAHGKPPWVPSTPPPEPPTLRTDASHHGEERAVP